MSTEKLKLEVILEAVNRVTKPMESMKASSVALSKALAAAKGNLRDLSDQQKLVDAFRSTNKAIGITNQDLDKAQALVKKLKTEMDATAAPSAKMQRAFAEATTKARDLAAAANRLTEKKQRLRTELTAAGINTKTLANDQRELKTRIEAATAAVAKQTAAAEAHGKRMQQLHAARATYEKSLATRDKLAGAGASAMVAGAAIGAPVAMAAKDYANFETAMLGVARQVDGARDANGKLTATYYEMGEAIKAMGERIPMTTVEIAKIVEAGARMGIQGKANLLTYAETTAVMAQAFDLPVDQIGENVGKISQLYKIPIKDIKALGDTINWLDDNALAKGGDIIDVMQRVAGAADMVHMSYKDAAALGSTFLSLGAGAEVAGTATNAMIGQLANAPMLATAKRYRQGLEMLKLDAKSLQLGMNKDATGTILKVLEAIKALPQEKQLEAATRLFGKEYGDDASKLAQNLDEYRRQLLLVNEARAKGSMQREGDARKDTIDARMVMAKNAIFNLSSDLGAHLKPALVETMERTLAIVQGVRDWAKENPGFAAGLMTAVKYLALFVTGAGALLLVAAGILGPLAAVKFGLAAIGTTGGAAAAGMWAVLKPVLLVGAAFYAGYKAGELLNAGLNALLSYLLGYKTTLGGALFDLVQIVSTLPARFMTAGGQIVDGLIAGIKARWAALREAVTGIGDASVGWLKDKLGIKSPSRVFAEIGGFTMAGLEQGIIGGKDGPLGAIMDTAKRMAAAGAGVMIGGAAMAGDLPRIDTRPAMAAMATAGAAAPMQVTINIYPLPGQSPEDIGREVARQLQQLDSQRAARSRSRFTDSE